MELVFFSRPDAPESVSVGLRFNALRVSVLRQPALSSNRANGNAPRPSAMSMTMATSN
jgi:hypothetical protein